MHAGDGIDDLLPLPSATLHILLALAEGQRHGYAIIQDVEARTDGELRMSAGTLYRSIARMVDQGLITEVARRRTRADDERRRYYRLTSFGEAVARAVAVVVIGGQSLCLLLTLIATPVAYTLLDDLGRKLQWRHWRIQPEPDEESLVPSK